MSRWFGSWTGRCAPGANVVCVVLNRCQKEEKTVPAGREGSCRSWETTASRYSLYQGAAIPSRLLPSSDSHTPPKLCLRAESVPRSELTSAFLPLWPSFPPNFPRSRGGYAPPITAGVHCRMYMSSFGDLATRLAPWVNREIYSQISSHLLDTVNHFLDLSVPLTHPLCLCSAPPADDGLPQYQLQGS